MYSKQIALIFSDFGLDDLYKKYQIPLEIHGLLDDPKTGQRMEKFLSVYDFSSQDSTLFDEFLAHYNLFQLVVIRNPGLPFDYMDWNRPNNEYFL